MAEAGPVLVMARSDCATIVTDCVAELLPLFGSDDAEGTLAVSTAGPLAGGGMGRGGVGADPPLAIDPTEQLAAPPNSGPQLQPVPENVNEVTPAGKVFVTIMMLVGSGPALERPIANESGLPALTGLLDAVFVTDRSAAVITVVDALPVLLLAVFGSNSVAVTDAPLVMLPRFGAFNCRLTLTD